MAFHIARSAMLEALRLELLGPGQTNEQIDLNPTARYLVGRLAPHDERLHSPQQNATKDDINVEPPELQAETISVLETGDKDHETIESSTRGSSFKPSSMGLSFLVGQDATQLTVRIRWGDYRYSETDRGKWQRHQRDCVIDGLTVAETDGALSITLTTENVHRLGAALHGDQDSKLEIRWTVRTVGGVRAISFFLVNRREKADGIQRDEQWIFQPELILSSVDDRPIFIAKDSLGIDGDADEDEEEQANALLYHDVREFASGHGVAVGWKEPGPEGKCAAVIYTEFIPEHEVPQLVAEGADTGGAVLDMKLLTEADTSEVLVQMLRPMLIAYRRWIDSTRNAMASASWQSEPALRDAAVRNVERCVGCADRIERGLKLLVDDRKLFKAFQFANRVMWDQRIHTKMAEASSLSEDPLRDVDVERNRTWRPFQIAFILMNLEGIANEASPDRSIVDLLWFPTGGGKTEAYLGLAAVTLGLRRLRGDRHGMRGDGGVTIIMRYTLRLLTIQQFQRAAALIAACEVERRQHPELWGEEPFMIGLWVGGGTTPNSFSQSKEVMDGIKHGRIPTGCTPVQFAACPRCGTSFIGEKKRPLDGVYRIHGAHQRTLVYCPNHRCEFSDDPGLPVVVVDDELYRVCPSLVVATVDKFAQLPFKAEARMLFGLRDRYSNSIGHLTSASEHLPKGVRSAAPFLPPELIIQDELHLISGPLGTLVGLYETIVDQVTQVGPERIPAKIIASTATIKRAKLQVRRLYGRDVQVFPPPGITAGDSFFARESSSVGGSSGPPGRMYIGISAPGISQRMLLAWVYAALLAAAQRTIDDFGPAADPYGTLVGYFNSLRALGGAARIVADNVKQTRLEYLRKSGRYPQRRQVKVVEELTSRISHGNIPQLLKQLRVAFPAKDGEQPVDVLLATNMLSVGVDIDRLGLMVVAGQPKSTAEYIQATSRVGRHHPGLVVTIYNWPSPRDISHYERFHSYHGALYRYVEAVSVTPFSARALDRGLRAVLAALVRLKGTSMAGEKDARNFTMSDPNVEQIIGTLASRVRSASGDDDTARHFLDELAYYAGQWVELAGGPLRYHWPLEQRQPTEPTGILLRTTGTSNLGRWPAPGSLREVEPTATFYLQQQRYPDNDRNR